MKLHFYAKKLLLVLFSISISFFLKAQKNFFTTSRPTGKYQLESGLKSYAIHTLDQNSFKQYLAESPLEFGSNSASTPVLINMPLPDGSIETYQMFESPVLSPEIAAQYPDIKTYTGKSQKIRGSTIRISFTSNGFDAIITGTSKDAIYFQKAILNDSNDNSIISYFGSKATKPTKPSFNSKCGTINLLKKATTGVTIFGETKTTLGTPNLITTGADLKTFRLAVSATAEFTAFKGSGSKTTAYASIVAFVNRLIAVYRSELSISFTLISTTNLVFTTVGVPFNNSSTTAMIAQNQTTVDNIIGTNNYDLAFVLGTSVPNSSSGGIAATPSVGTDGSKAQDAIQVQVDNTFAAIFDDQTIAHEVGHQFSMTHSFNSSIPVCTTREPSTSVEVGSGTTIMSYGYTCNDNTGNDDYENSYLPILNFHAVNYSQAVNFLTTIPTVYTSTASGNIPPAISSITPDKTIPKLTPFFLTGTATDANANDVLSYSWEGTNIGMITPVPSTFANTSQPPFFRTYQPSNSATRYFPRLSAILDGTNVARGEKLPSIGIVTTHRFTVRDNATGINTGTVDITIDGNSGPFLETTNLSGIYTSGTAQTITWSVNNTNAAPVNCANITILLSIDGGQTFPYTLAASTPNNGSAQITFPSLTSTTTTARIKVQAADNIFFDISNNNFTISASLPVTLTGINAYQKNTSVMVEWTVLNEVNVKKYDIEKSTDGVNFIKVGEVAAIKANRYNWLDNSPYNRSNYYRLMSVDNDGSVQYSQSVLVKIGTMKNLITILNNPVLNKKVQLQMENTDKGIYYINLYNQLGQLVSKNEVYHNGGNATYGISLSNLSKGAYKITISNTNDFRVNKTIIVD